MLTLLTSIVTSAPVPPTQAPAWAWGEQAITLVLSQDQLPKAPTQEKILTPSKVTPLSKLIGTLTCYENLPEDWDGYGGVPPIGETISNATEFVSLLPSDLPLPKPMLSGNGDVGLYWKTESLYIDIEFEGDGTYSYYAEKSGDSPRYDDKISISTAKLPEELEQILYSLSA